MTCICESYPSMTSDPWWNRVNNCISRWHACNTEHHGFECFALNTNMQWPKYSHQSLCWDPILHAQCAWTKKKKSRNIHQIQLRNWKCIKQTNIKQRLKDIIKHKTQSWLRRPHPALKWFLEYSCQIITSGIYYMGLKTSDHLITLPITT